MMWTNQGKVAALTAISALMLFSLGCDKSEPSAQPDWKIDLAANPASIVVPADVTQLARSQITATIFDLNGNVQRGIGIRFSTSAGKLKRTTDADGPDCGIVKSDERGEAVCFLFTREETKVTATSGSVKQPVDIKVSGTNERPTANISHSPKDKARAGVSTVFSGAQSEDDGEIVNYTWTFVSSNPDTARGQVTPWTFSTTNQGFNWPYATPQHLDITLKVEDDQGAIGIDSSIYDFLANLPPVADAGPDSSGTKGSGTNYTCVYQLNPCGSTDADAAQGGKIVAQDVTWGDGRVDAPSALRCPTSHTYLAPGEYTVTLRVYDNGIGDSDPRCSEIPPTTAGCPEAATDTDEVKVTCAP